MKLEIELSFKYFRTVKQKNKLVRLVFGRIYGALICLRFYLTFIMDILIGQLAAAQNDWLSWQKKPNKFVRWFFGRIYGAPICFRFYLTFAL